MTNKKMKSHFHNPILTNKNFLPLVKILMKFHPIPHLEIGRVCPPKAVVGSVIWLMQDIERGRRRQAAATPLPRPRPVADGTAPLDTRHPHSAA